MNMIMQTLLAQLQQRNPGAYQFINQAMSSNGNPNVVLQQMLGNSTPEQRENLIKQAKNYGVPDSLLTQIQNMK